MNICSWLHRLGIELRRCVEEWWQAVRRRPEERFRKYSVGPSLHVGDVRRRMQRQLTVCLPVVESPECQRNPYDE